MFVNRPEKTLKEDFTASKGGLSGLSPLSRLSGSSPLRSDSSWDRQETGLRERRPKAFKTELAQREPSGSSPLRSNGSHCVGEYPQWSSLNCEADLHFQFSDPKGDPPFHPPSWGSQKQPPPQDLYGPDIGEGSY
jgi:hypothetical protein